MELFKRALRVLAVFVLANLGLLEMLHPLPGAVHWLLLLGLLGFYVWLHICPRRAKGAAAARHDRRIRAAFGLFFAAGGRDTVLCRTAVRRAAACACPVFCAAVGGACGKPAGFPAAGGCAADKRLFPRGPHLAASPDSVARAAAVFVVAALF